MRVYPQINNSLLGDAAASAGADLWIKFPQLQDWIEGAKKPTVNQLADFAKASYSIWLFLFGKPSSN